MIRHGTIAERGRDAPDRDRCIMVAELRNLSASRPEALLKSALLDVSSAIYNRATNCSGVRGNKRANHIAIG